MSRDAKNSLMAAGGLAALVVVVALIVACVGFAVKADRANRQDCVDRGGRPERVHSGKGGWVCLGAVR